MEALLSLVGRNNKVFRRDKAAVFSHYYQLLSLLVFTHYFYKKHKLIHFNKQQKQRPSLLQW